MTIHVEGTTLVLRNATERLTIQLHNQCAPELFAAHCAKRLAKHISAVSDEKVKVVTT